MGRKEETWSDTGHRTDQRLEEREREKEGKRKKSSECWEKRRRKNRSEEISTESERGG